MRDGRLVADLALGEARTGEPMRPDTSMLWLSSGKPITALGVAVQVEAGTIDLDDPVVEFVPEFGQREKESVTIRHVLSHTGGFRSVVFRYPQQTWDEAIDAVCAGRLEAGWVPGETAGYHPHSGWNILGRVLEVCTGQPVGAYLRAAVLEPLGMDRTWVGMTDEAYEREQGRLAVMMDTSGSEAMPTFEGREWVTGTRPGGNVYGPASELAGFYAALLEGGRGVVSPETIRLFTDRSRRDTLDRTFRANMDWGLGFMVNNRRYDAANAETHPSGTPYGFGPWAGESAYGHGGYQSSVGFADPEHGIAVAVVFNGVPGEPRHQARMRGTLDALYRDLGLAEG